jgi:RNA-binding protein YlmH
LSPDQLFLRYSEESDRRWIKYLMEEIGQLHEGKKEWVSGFLSPYRRQITEEVFGKYPDIRYSAYGGHAEARRVRIKAWVAGEKDAGLPPVDLIFLNGASFPDTEFEYELLQYLYDAGAEEDMIGDLIRDGEKRGIRVFVADNISSMLRDQLNRIDPAEARVEKISRSLPAHTDDRTDFKMIKGTVASARLDAVISLALRISRSRAASIIKENLVQVNRKAATSPSCRLKEKDVIATSKGTFIIESLPGKSRKGRSYIIIKKFYK